MRIWIDRKKKEPLYLQIAGQIKAGIFDGSLVDGYPLPSERTLAKELGVHRNTVVRAYADLKAEGLIVSYQGLGHRISYRNLFYGMVKKPVNWEALIKDDYVGMESDFDRLYSKAYEKNLISFGGGVAAREPYPAEELVSVFEQVITDRQEMPYFYTPVQGDRQLRREIAGFMGTKGIITKESNLQIFSENNQALDFLMTLMLSPGDGVVTQEILSPDVYRAIELAGGKLLTVPMDEKGMQCEHLEALLQKEKPKFIYVDSSFHNPTGVMLSLERRQILLELSYKYRIPIIEEDEGSELYYDKKTVPSIKSMDTGNNVVYMYSFSLTMVPGIGLSFVVADREIVKRLSQLISMRVVTLDWAPQMVLKEYMKQGIFQERLEEFRSICREKRDLMYGLLEELKEEFALSMEKPRGGVYFWVRLPEAMDGRSLLKEAEKEGVTFIPGSVFFPKKNSGRDWIRLNYSYPTKDQILQGMKKLQLAMRRIDAENSDKINKKT